MPETHRTTRIDTADPSDINRALSELRQDLDEQSGMLGPVTLHDALTVEGALQPTGYVTPAGTAGASATTGGLTFADGLYTGGTVTSAAQVCGGGYNQTAAGTVYIPLFGPGSGTEALALWIAPIAGSISTLRYRLSAALTAGQTATLTLRVNKADTALTVAMVSGEQAKADTTHSVTVAAGDLVNFSSTVSAARAISFGVTFTPA